MFSKEFNERSRNYLRNLKVRMLGFRSHTPGPGEVIV